MLGKVMTPFTYETSIAEYFHRAAFDFTFILLPFLRTRPCLLGTREQVERSILIYPA